jgi:hypothetical protein
MHITSTSVIMESQISFQEKTKNSMLIPRRLNVWPRTFATMQSIHPKFRQRITIPKLKEIVQEEGDIVPKLADIFKMNQYPSIADFTLGHVEKYHLECPHSLLDDCAKCLITNGKLNSMDKWLKYYGVHRTLHVMDYIISLAAHLHQYDLAMYYLLSLKKLSVFSGLLQPGEDKYTNVFSGDNVNEEIHERTFMKLIRGLLWKRRRNDLVEVMELCYHFRYDKALGFAFDSICNLDSTVAGSTEAIPIEVLKECPSLLSTLFKHLIRSKHITKALELHEKLEIPYEPHVYLTFIHYFTTKDCGSIQQASYWYTLYKKHGHIPTKVVLGRLINFLKLQSKFSCDLFDQTEKIFLDYDYYDIELDPVSCGSMIDFYCIHGKQERIFGLLRRMKSQNIPINLHICHSLMRYFVKSEQFEKVPEILEMVEIAEPSLQGILTNTDPTRLEKVEHTELYDHCGLEYICVELLNYLYKSNQLQQLVYYFKVIQKFQIPVGGHFYSAWIVNLRRRDETEQIFQVLDHTANHDISLNATGISNAIGIISRVPRQTVNDFFDIILNHQNPEIDHLILTASMFVYLRARDYHSALVLWKRLSSIQTTVCAKTKDPRVDPFLKTQFVIPVTGFIELCLVQCQNPNEEVRRFWIDYLLSKMEYWIDKGFTFDRNSLFVLKDYSITAGAYYVHLQLLEAAIIRLASLNYPLPSALTDIVYHLHQCVVSLKSLNSIGKLKSFLYMIHRCQRHKSIPPKLRLALDKCHFSIINAIERIKTLKGLH